MKTKYNDYMKFNEKIVTLRIKKGLSQQDVANATNVTRQAVQKWERGQSQPNIDSLKILGSLFGVSLDYLLNDELGIDVEDPNKKQEEKVTESPNEKSEEKKVENQKNINKKSKKKAIPITLSIVGVLTMVIVLVGIKIYSDEQNKYNAVYQDGDFTIVTQIIYDGDLALVQITPKYEMHDVSFTNDVYAGVSLLMPYYEDKQTYKIWEENKTLDFSYTSEQVGKKITKVNVRITSAFKQNKNRN